MAFRLFYFFLLTPKIIRILKTFIGWLFIYSCSFAQVGTPFIHNYTPKEYSSDDYSSSPQNFSIVQDSRGVIYVGNVSGILEYDGVKMRMVKGTNFNYMMRLAKDKYNRIFAGGMDKLGFLAPDSLGLMTFVSLVENIEVQNRKFVVNRITCSNSEIYFISSDKIFRFTFDSISFRIKQVKSWHTDAKYFGGHLVNNNFYISEGNNIKETQLKTLSNDSLVPAFTGSEIEFMPINAMLPWNEKILIATTDQGLFLLNKNKAYPLATEVDSVFKSKQIYCANFLPDGSLGIGTKEGFFIINPGNGKMIALLNKEHGLQDDWVINFFTDEQKGIWLALNKGFSRVEVLSPASFFNETSGLQGIVMSIIRYKGILYAATTKGIYYLDTEVPLQMKPVFKLIGKQSLQGWYFLITGNNLLAATNLGIFQVHNNQLKILDPNISYCLHRAKKDSSLIFAGLERGLISFRYQNGILKEYSKVEGIDEVIRSIVETDNNKLWLRAEGKGVILIDASINYDNLTLIGKFHDKEGLSGNNIHPIILGDKILFGTNKGIYSFNEKSKTFLIEESLSQIKESTSKIINDNNGNIWIKASGKFGKFVPQTKIWDTALSLRIPKTAFWSIYADENTQILVGSSDGLWNIDNRIIKEYNTQFSPLIRKISLENDSVIFYGTYWENKNSKKLISLIQPDELKYSLPYSFNSLTFEYAAPSFDNESANQFSYFLEGQDKDWSAWSSETKKQYTNLSEGKYVFHLKAKNVYNHIGKEATYEFTILPPWYRTSLAYVGYGIFFIAFVYMIIRLNSRRLEEANKRLQEKIRLATVEIVQQKDEISKKNKDITSSIKYAKRIQDSSLPIIDNLKLLLPDSFILFRPRDIVSGDFYWFGSCLTPTLSKGEGGNPTTALPASPQPSPKEREEEVAPTTIPNNSEQAGAEAAPLSFGEGSGVRQSGVVLIAAVDCTGHGVPGAFMSLIGNNIMNDIILKAGITHPTVILKKMNDAVSHALKKDVQDSDAVDGMDIALCCIDLENKKIDFAGAGRSLVLVRRTESGVRSEEKKEPTSNIQLPTSNSQSPNSVLPTPNYELTEIKGNKVPIGLILKKEIVYKTHEVKIQAGDTFYIFTDGYCDQFGNDGQNKFQMNRFEKMLLEIQDKSMIEQKEIISATLDTWKGTHPQVDDILVIGMRF